MKRSKLLSLTLVTTLSLFIVVMILLSAVQVAARVPEVPESAPLAPGDAPVLTVTIRSSPYAALDLNSPDDLSKLHVLVLEADVENSGPVSATNVALTMDYDDPEGGWVLLSGENPRRTFDAVEPAEHAYAYWFAAYPAPDKFPTTPLTHTYTVTVSADNAGTVATSENVYGDALPPGVTLQTASMGFNETGATPTITTTADAGVGAIFTATVVHNIGNNPGSVIFSPAGNATFDASTLRLVDVDIVLQGSDDSQELANRVYVPEIPAALGNKIQAHVTYTFLPQRPGEILLCPYAAIIFNPGMYDNDFCTGDNVLAIDASLSLSFTATVDRALVQQGELLTYTLTYTNHGDLGVNNAWFWSEIDPAVGSVLMATMTPPGDTSQTTGSRAVWSIDTIGAVDQPNNSGTLTFQVLVDGDGSDVPDGTDLVANSYFGVEFGNELPGSKILTETVTTTVQAPALAIVKDDGLASAEPLDVLTYDVQVSNSGSIPARNVVITDVLPYGVTYNGGAGETSQDGPTLLWDDGSSLGAGETTSLAIPVTIEGSVPNGTVLTNTATVRYQNDAGYSFDPRLAVDQTMVNAPVLSIYKSAGVNSVLTGRPLTYTLTYSNGGPAPATGVIITDVVPAGTTYSDCAGGSSCSYDGNMVSWTVGTIPAQSEGSVSFTVLADSGLATGDILVNDDYGLLSDQSGYITGPGVNTTVARDAAIFDGYTFVDDDLDGVYDEGEGPLPAVPLTLPAAVVGGDVSDPDGYYAFRVEQEGPVTLSAGLPTGYFRTTVGTVPAYATLGLTQTINFGYAPIEAGAATITGIVFDDANGNGLLDGAEQGIPNVTITLDGTTNTLTDQNGRYTLATPVEGLHTVVETDPAGYTSTTPNSVNVDVVVGQNYQVDFGDMVAGGEATSIFGTVFEDNNGDGLQDAGEPGLAGVELTLDGGDTTTTNAFGSYTFATTPGNHTVVETDAAGYKSTTPNTVNVSLAAGESAQVDFGDVTEVAAFTSIYGTVFDDTDGNGVQDAGETGIAGVELTLDGSETATTNQNGGYSFATGGGNHTVVETDPAGYTSTTPNSVNLSVTGGESVQVDFGDMAEGGKATSIFGTVFEDNNGDGLQGADELGLAGVEITLDGGDSVTTNAFGGYTFATAPGNHTVVEADPTGYTSTTPNSVNVSVVAGEGAQVDFGDVAEGAAFTSIYGTVFEDTNGDGVQDGDETGISGVELTLDGSETTTTNTNGGYTFPVAEGDHTLVESDPAGYVSTTPNTVNVAVAAGNTYQVDFGDMIAGGDATTIYGTVFNDINGDGIQEAGEPGLAGVEISLDGSDTTTTNAWGGYTFATIAGNHTISETDPAGFVSSTPNSVNVSVVAGASVQVDFGDVAEGAGFASIFGIVFEDSDGDGIQDAGEGGLAGVELTLDGAETTTTNANGIYAFPVVIGGHTLVETDPPGYTSTTPNAVNLDVVAGQQYQVDFGDLAGTEGLAVIYGTVFDDANANGIQDSEELGIQGVQLNLDGSETATTNVWGGYTFSASPGQVHQIAEQDPDNYTSTTPNVVYVDVVAAGSYRVDFGDLSMDSDRSAIYGTVFDDVDRSGGRDAGEIGLQGVTVTIGDLTRITDLYGRYTFPIVEAGQYTVVETDLEGFGSSTPNRVAVEVSAGATAQVDFGDYALCEVDAYEEDDMLAGAGAITLSNRQARNFCDDSVDWVTLDATAGGKYTFTTDATGERADTVLTLYATDGQTMLTGNDDSEGTGSFSSTFVWSAPADGTYYLRVRNRAGLYGAGTGYELTVDEEVDDTVYLFLPVIYSHEQPAQDRIAIRRFRSEAVAELATRTPAAPAGNIVHSCPDPYEVDDHWTMARTLLPGALETHSFDSDTTRYAADKDFFRFTLTPHGTFAVDVSPVPGTHTELELYDENGMMLDVSGSTSLFYDGPAGTYYLSVSPTSPTFGCAGEAGYTLQAELTGSQTFLPIITREVATE